MLSKHPSLNFSPNLIPPILRIKNGEFGAFGQGRGYFFVFDVWAATDVEGGSGYFANA